MYAVFGQTVLNQSEIKNGGSYSFRWMLVILLFDKNASTYTFRLSTLEKISTVALKCKCCNCFVNVVLAKCCVTFFYNKLVWHWMVSLSSFIANWHNSIYLNLVNDDF